MNSNVVGPNQIIKVGPMQVDKLSPVPAVELTPFYKGVTGKVPDHIGVATFRIGKIRWTS